MTDAEPAAAAYGDAVFAMDPEETLRSLARQLIEGQQAIAELVRGARRLEQVASDDEVARQLLANLETAKNQWLNEALPSLAASMKLAVEVFDTFGPGRTTIDNDPTEAAIWNNKYFVWSQRLSGNDA